MENALGLTQSNTEQLFENGTLAFDEVTRPFDSTDLQLGYTDFWPYYQTYHHYWPLTTVVAPNKTETAFKVVKVLIDKKLAKIDTVKQFVLLMDELTKVL